jgi:hypothetical protein
MVEFYQNVKRISYNDEDIPFALKASAIAKHIVVQPRKMKLAAREPRQSMFSQIVKHNRSTLIPWDSCVKNKGTQFSFYLTANISLPTYNNIA